jgi:hypothetical protein
VFLRWSPSSRRTSRLRAFLSFLPGFSPLNQGCDFARSLACLHPDDIPLTSSLCVLSRCIGFTGGSEAEALIRTLDEIILSYVSALFEVLKSLRSVCGVDASTSAPTTTGHDDAGEEDWSTVQVRPDPFRVDSSFMFPFRILCDEATGLFRVDHSFLVLFPV